MTDQLDVDGAAAGKIGLQFVHTVFALMPRMTPAERVEFAGLMRWFADRIERGDST